MNNPPVQNCVELFAACRDFEATLPLLPQFDGSDEASQGRLYDFSVSSRISRTGIDVTCIF